MSQPSDECNAPKHVAIIMDGNGRWANKRGLARFKGHKTGVETVKRIVKTARSQGVEYLTLYSFSTENWSRPTQEVTELMGLLKVFIRKDLAELHQNNVRLKVIGDMQNLPKDIGPMLEDAQLLTKDNTAQTLVIAFNYG
ncbi:MAG: polyprenyl diphosphate synthase, partial [Nitratireductor sp.]